MISDLPAWLSSRLARPLPGQQAQRAMEPELSYGRSFGPARCDARAAAVLLLLIKRHGDWHLPLMLRPDTMVNHAGQISLPGGAIDAAETSEEAALRELEEELGVPRHAGLLLGQLSPLYVYGTNFHVTPWVAVARTETTFVPSPAEVAEVLEVPLAHLFDPAHRSQHHYQRGTVKFDAPHYNWNGHRIWGVTSMILAELQAILAGK